MNWGGWAPQENILKNVEDTLQLALVPNSEAQKTVQERLNVMQNLSDFDHYLLFIVENRSFREDIRSLSGILLKNHLQSTYANLPDETVDRVRLACMLLLREPSREVRISISNIVVVLAKNNLKSWPDLVPALLKCFVSQDEYSETALTTLFKVCEEMISSQKAQEEIHKVTKDVFPKFIEYLTMGECGMQRDIIRLTNQFLQDYFVVMKQSINLEAYLNNVISLANTDDVELQKHVCHTFVVYIENHAEALVPYLHSIVCYLLEKCHHEDQEVALQACEFWLASTKLPTCKEFLTPFIDKLLPTLLRNMRYSDSELNLIKDTLGSDANKKDLSKDISPFHFRDKSGEGDECCSEEELEETGDDFDDFYVGWTLRKCSAASLDSIAMKFGDDILQLLTPLISEMLNSQDHLVKESAILALGAIAGGCMNGLKNELPNLVQFLILSMNDQHSIIRVITCWTLSRYVAWIVNVRADNLQIYFVPVMTELLKHFTDDNKRVQRAAISAFCIFQEEAQTKLVPYVGYILDAFKWGFEKFQCRSLYLLYDAIGVLAQCVGNQLSKEEHCNKLLPPLMKKFSELNGYYDDHFIAVLECVSSVIPALEVSFLPYSESVFMHCLQLINDTLMACINYQHNPNEYDPPDKEPMNVAHDVLYSMALGLKSHFVKYVTSTNLIYLLYTTMQDTSNLIRQTAIALYGELVGLCYPYLATTITDYVPLIVQNINEQVDGVCNNAAWVVGRLCSVMGNGMQPYLPEILNLFIHILQNPTSARTMHKTVAISLCIVLYVCPDLTVPNMEVVIKNCCMIIRNVRDSEEKDLAFRGLCEVIVRHPEFTKNYFIFFCDACASWVNLRPDLKQIVRNVLIGSKQQCGDENWRELYGQFPDALKAKLQDLYGVKCPQHLMAPLIKIVIDEMRKACKKNPPSYGYNPVENAYEPLKLMQAVMAKINEVCLRYLDNSMLCSLPSPVTPYFPTSVCAVKNIRRKMEDRHVVIHDLNMMFNIQEASPSSYYAVFDGHAGSDAAIYSSAHLHQFLAESKYFITNPEQALYEAFAKTDSMFVDKCKVDNLRSGTTALVALLRPKERTVYVAWAGDSLALLVNRGKVLQIVNAHKPDRPDEKRRIEREGGCVLLFGTWRVNGQLAVSRAIGDVVYKPYVIAVPEIREIPFDGGEDFLILACDGLWDFVSEDSAARMVYHLVMENPEDTDRISGRLAQLAKEQGSEDNISVIVVFLKEPSKVAAEARRATRDKNMETTGFETNAGELPNNNPFAMPITNNTAQSQSDIISQKADGLLLNLSDKFKMNGTNLSNFNDDNFGPETDVDPVDPPAYENNSKPELPDLPKGDPVDGTEGHFNPFMEHQEKAALEMEKSLLQKKEEELSLEELKRKFDEEDLDEEDEEVEEVAERKVAEEAVDGQKGGREETPTPPADAVHDVGGLEETAADTESEDEWNYIKGDLANKENIPPQPKAEVGDISAEDGNMSQLNPNAAEFVPVSPVSPTRSTASPPPCRMLIDEDLVSQSPVRAPQQEIDIDLPDQKDFEREVKSRPSEIETGLNNHDESDSGNPTDLIENILNGKNIDDIPEFHPGSTPKKTAKDEFHFGPNAGPFTPVKLHDQSEATSTKALFGDDTGATLGTTLDSNQDVSTLNKEFDPMSMSFYADKQDENPFDLERVQMVPDNIEEFLKSDDQQRTVNNDDAIQTTDLDKHYDDEKELASPLEPDRELLEDTKTPEPTHENLLGGEFCCDNGTLRRSDVENLPEDVELISPEPPVDRETTKEATEVADLLGASLDQALKDIELLPLDNDESISPLSADRGLPDLLQYQQESQRLVVEQSLLPEVPASPIQVIASPVSETTASPEPARSPAPKVSISPLLDVTSSPNPDRFEPAARGDTTPDFIQQELLEKAEEHFNELCRPDEPKSSSVPHEDPELVINEDRAISDEIALSSEMIASPVSQSEPEVPTAEASYELEQDHFHFSDTPPVGTSERGEQIDIKTESITPEFAEKAVLTPSEESRNDEVEEAVKALALPPLEEPPVKIEDAQLKEKTDEKIGAVKATTKAKADVPKKTVGAKKPATASTKTTAATAARTAAKTATTTASKTAAPRVASATKTASPRTNTTPRTSSDKPLSSPRLRPPPAAAKSLDKKPITNGDVPSMARTTLTAKKEVSSKISSKPFTITSKVTSTTAPKPASARTVTAPKVPAARPASKSSTTTRTTTTTTITTAKRPTTLGTSRTAAGAVTSTTKTTTSTATKMSPRLAPTKPRVPSSTITSARPRVPLAKTTPDAEKQIKESANKITASKNITSRMPPTASARSVTARRFDTKVSSTHTIVSKTTTTTMKSTTGKKPVEIVKNATSKTKTTKIEKPKENGVSTVVTEELRVVNAMIDGEPQLLKDNSPLDNKLVVESLIQTNTTAD